MENLWKCWLIFYDKIINPGVYNEILKGLGNTMYIAVVGLVIGIVVGTLIAVVKVVPKYSKVARILDKICTVYVAFFRGTPMVVQLLVGYYVILPLTGLSVNSLNVCVLIFGLNSGAYVSEIMRGGIMSVDIGQMEAGRALGLSYGVSMIKIVIPQAIKNILPTLGNEFITLVKETAVVSFVGAFDLYKAFTNIGSSTYEYKMPYFAMAVVYIVLVLIISLGIKAMERRLRKSDRRN